MDLEELKGQLDADLDKSVISSKTILSRFRFLDDRAKNTGAYSDPHWIPFYYHLGKRMKATSLLHVGFGLGIESGTFLLGCRTVENLLGFQDPRGEYYSLRVGINNIKDKYRKGFRCFACNILNDELVACMGEREWDVIIQTEMTQYDEHRSYFDICWSYLKYGGLLVVDYVTSHDPNRQAVDDFCKIVNREPIMLDTRYGVAIIEK